MSDSFDDHQNMYKVLLLLIQKGADIDAVDDIGICVTEYAYTRGHDFDNGGVGDIWDRVLVEFHRDLLASRKACPRRPDYDRYYSGNDFEDLWAGCEQECPYFDDPPQWPSEQSRQLDSSQSAAHHIGRDINADDLERS